MKRSLWLSNRRKAWRKAQGMPMRKARAIARQKGICLRCLSRPWVKWKRCPECLHTHSERRGRGGNKPKNKA